MISRLFEFSHEDTALAWTFEEAHACSGSLTDDRFFRLTKSLTSLPGLQQPRENSMTHLADRSSAYEKTIVESSRGTVQHSLSIPIVAYIPLAGPCSHAKVRGVLFGPWPVAGLCSVRSPSKNSVFDFQSSRSSSKKGVVEKPSAVRRVQRRTSHRYSSWIECEANTGVVQQPGNGAHL